MATIDDLSNTIYSGDIRIDALLGDPPYWNFLRPYRNELFYTFDPSQTDGGVSFNAVQRDATRSAMAYAGSVTGIRFTEVASAALADFHFGLIDIPDPWVIGSAWVSSRYSYNPLSEEILYIDANAIIWLDNVDHRSETDRPVAGTYGYEVLLHEIGHALGLKHPFEGDPVLPWSLDNTTNTLMSYTHSGADKTVFQAFDLAALYWMYGGDGLAGEYGYGGRYGPVMSDQVQPPPAEPADDRLIELYIAYFNRAPEFDGLEYWRDRLDVLRIQQGRTEDDALDVIAGEFWQAAQQYAGLTGYTSGMSDFDFVAKVYANVLGRPDAAVSDRQGIQYWLDALANGHIAARSDLIGDLLQGAYDYIASQPQDPVSRYVSAYLDNRLEVARYFAREDISGGLQNEDALRAGIRALESVTSDPASVEQSITLIGGITDPAGLFV